MRERLQRIAEDGCLSVQLGHDGGGNAGKETSRRLEGHWQILMRPVQVDARTTRELYRYR